MVDVVVVITHLLLCTANIHTDQGFLYYYTKYVRQSVSIVWGNTVENWGPAVDSNDDDAMDVQLESILQDPFAEVKTKYGHLAASAASNCKYQSPNGCFSPIKDYEHFWDIWKPWQQGQPKDWATGVSRLHLWYQVLHNVTQEFGLSLSQDEIQTWGVDEKQGQESYKPPVGFSNQVWKPNSRNEVSSRLSFCFAQVDDE